MKSTFVHINHGNGFSAGKGSAPQILVSPMGSRKLMHAAAWFLGGTFRTLVVARKTFVKEQLHIPKSGKAIAEAQHAI